jgi:hypothetical protein
VTVPAGQVFAFFLVATAPVATTTTVQIAATAGGVTSTLGLVLWGTGAHQPGSPSAREGAGEPGRASRGAAHTPRRVS